MASDLKQRPKDHSDYETTRRPGRQANVTAKEDDYFERGSILHYIVIVTGIVCFEVLCFQTEYFPYKALRGPGSRLLYLVENHLTILRLGYVFSIILHGIEAAYAYSQCRSINSSKAATRKWVMQTFILGYGSLRLLNKYCEEKTNKKS